MLLRSEIGANLACRAIVRTKRGRKLSWRSSVTVTRLAEMRWAREAHLGMGTGSACNTEAVSSAVNARSSELWLAGVAKQRVPPVRRPLLTGSLPHTTRLCAVAHAYGSHEAGAAPRLHHPRLRPSRSLPPSATTPQRAMRVPPPIESSDGGACKASNDVSAICTTARWSREGASSHCGLACRCGWAGHSWIRRAESRQLGGALAGGGKIRASHIVRFGRCDCTVTPSACG